MSSVRRSGPTGCSAPNWRSWARSSMWTSGLQTAHAPTPVASIEPRSGVASIPSAQSNYGRPRVACIASCTLSRFQRTFRRRSCAVANGLFGASGSKRRSARPAYEFRTRGIECSDAERPQSFPGSRGRTARLGEATPRANRGRSRRGQNQRPALRSPEQTAPSRMTQSLGILSMRPVLSSMIRRTLSLTRKVRPQ